MLYDMILSIKPCYVKEIINGNKKYEFRKSKPLRKVEKIYIYETKPFKKIIGYFKYDNVISGDKYSIWNKFKQYGCISKEDYFKYYRTSLKAYAFNINKLILFKQYIDPYKIFDKFTAPQSYVYIKKGILDGFICDLVRTKK